MSTTLKPYPEYRPAELLWMKRCPAHWLTVRPKSIFSRVQRPVRPEDGVVTCFRDGVVTLRSKRRTTGFTEAIQEIGYQGIRKGDLVIHAMDAFAGAIGVSDSDGKGTPVYAVCQPSAEADAYYYAFILREMSRSEFLLSLAKGIRERSTDFRYADFATLRVPLPPREEQAHIVRFISHLDHRVNRLIKAKRRLIELLNEQKQAIIHQAVTRGLDPTVPLKPSGIDWLGDVPEHWRVMRIRHVADMLVSNVDKHSHEHEEPVRLCNYVDVYKNEAITDQLRFMTATASKDEVGRFRIQIGDVIITKDSELWSDIGVPAVVRHQAEDLVCGYHLAILRPNASELSGEFLLRCLQDRLIATQLHVAANGITRYGLSQDSIKSCLVPVPPLQEQQELVTHLMGATRDLTLAITKAQAEIDLIREYRTRLVADVVTGQLDVRHLDLPEIEESLIESIESVEADDLEDSNESEEE